MPHLRAFIAEREAEVTKSVFFVPCLFWMCSTGPSARVWHLSPRCSRSIRYTTSQRPRELHSENIGAMDGLTQAEQREFQGLVEKRHMREFMQMYSNLVQRCFDDCVNDFTSKTMNAKEEGCISKCVEKWLKGSERMGQRFAEQNAAMMQGGGPLGGSR
ncbi:hypothetical protein H072_775 [Dactylellina haptotyla CBS 200.50]|uniref:Mitochondrial import inner membrane translocase subunit TIM9 n=1 Tax=Dactylellina haptotyla (strain CBS 200.50) TaxID=1284197 RepID=S8C0G6_DACHA|nr:hypothetical protein H072_775 [Dactylellina haptotyla CBS 200.50]